MPLNQPQTPSAPTGQDRCRKCAESANGICAPCWKSIWAADGAYARYLPGYAPRADQVKMAVAVGKAIGNGAHLMAEGGTGIGKSLAYLTPAILWAHHHRRPVVIATHTVNLQQQLIRKDIPNAIAALELANIIEPDAVQYAMLAGRSRYVCEHYAREYVAEHADGAQSRLSLSQATDPNRQLANQLAKWLPETETGEKEELSPPAALEREWRDVSAESSPTCPLYKKSPGLCHYAKAKFKAQNAAIVVVNQALLMQDLISDGAVAGIVGRGPVIIDEAHHFESVATDALGWETVRPIYNARWTNLRRHPDMARRANTLRTAGEPLWNAVEAYLAAEEPPPDDDFNLRITGARLRQPEWQTLKELAKDAIAAASDAASAVKARISALESESAQPKKEDSILAPTLNYLDNLHQGLTIFFNSESEQTVRWLSIDDKGSPGIHHRPLNVAPYLDGNLYPNQSSVAYASATLTHGRGDFSKMRRVLGFPPEGEAADYPSPFDYPRQAQLLIPSDMPECHTDDYRDLLPRILYDVATGLDGRTLALFTSNRSLRAVAEELKPRLKPHRIRVLAQNEDGDAAAVMRDYQDNPRTILMGVDSLWQGIDLPPEQLRAVVICRIPFERPNEPLSEARKEQYGKLWFSEYTLPNAMLKMKQGAGRLIRRMDSRGSLIILDQRMRSKSYGKQIQRSLPPYSDRQATTNTVGRQAADFIK